MLNVHVILRILHYVLAARLLRRRFESNRGQVGVDVQASNARPPASDDHVADVIFNSKVP